MAVSGNSSDGSPSVNLTARTPIFGLKLYVVTVVTTISEIRDSDHKKGSEIVEFERMENESMVICSVEMPKINGTKYSSSSESSTSQSEVSIFSAEGLNVGWGRWYSLKELEMVTSGFSVGNVIGEGGYGIVYRGVLLDSSFVAVKNLLNNK
ncbi:hypothetical protein LguiA_032684 [Lonicera macranthoides]